MSMSWKQHGDGKTVAPEAIVLPEERLSWPKTIGFGAQHVVAMFGATFLVPLLTGFPPTATLFFSASCWRASALTFASILSSCERRAWRMLQTFANTLLSSSASSGVMPAGTKMGRMI